LFFNLVEEGRAAPLLHLPRLLAESAISGSTAGLGCWLVAVIVQVTKYLLRFFLVRI
jgi:hypothetical protein